MRIIGTHSRSGWVAKCGCLALASACSAYKGTDLSYSIAIVHGVVSTATGSPIANADVAASSYFVPCPSNATGLGNVTTKTDGNGVYRLEVASPTAPAVRCVAVTVSSAGAGQKTVSGAQVQFKPQGDASYDSARVDVILP